MQNRSQPLPSFAPNEPVSSKQLNQLTHALRVPMRGVGSPKAVAQQYAERTYFQQFKIVSIQGDYLICNTFDGAMSGVDSIAVAKPYLLRQSTWNGTDDGTFSYAFTGTQTMTATKDSDDTTEDWEYTFDYEVGDLIIGIGNVRGGIGFSNGANYEYMDLNTDARAWAKV